MTHPIDAFCERHDLPLGQFAAGIGIRFSSLRRIRTGERRASTVLLERIHSFTKGEITANDIIAADRLPIRHRNYAPEAKRKCSEDTARHSGTQRSAKKAAA